MNFGTLRGDRRLQHLTTELPHHHQEGGYPSGQLWDGHGSAGGRHRLSRPEAPESVRNWMAAAPLWLHVQAPRVVDRSLDLDLGEREAICLALELNADRILLDEAKARRAAASRGLRVAGTLAILFEASERGLLDFREAVRELQQTTFHLDHRVVEAILSRVQNPKS